MSTTIPIEEKLRKLSSEVTPEDWVAKTPPHVYFAIAEVSKDLSEIGVAKNRENATQKFKFRGVDDVYQVLAKLLPKHGLVILPRVLNRTMTERKSSSGNALFSVVCEVEYSLVSTKDGSDHTVRFIGEGMDSGDKATNKAIAIAYKYMAFQVFCIPLEGSQDDPDSESHEVAGSGEKGAPPTKKPAAARTAKPATAPKPDTAKPLETLGAHHVQAIWDFARKLAPEKADHEALIKALLAGNGVKATKDLPACGPGGNPTEIWTYINWLDDSWRAVRASREVS